MRPIDYNFMALFTYFERLRYLNLFTPVELVDGEVLPAHGQRPLVDLGQLLLLHHVGEAATLFHDR